MDILNSNTKRSREIETLSLEYRKYPTDPFHTSPNTTLYRHSRHQSPEPENQEVGEELNLGLSLGGRFGVDKSHKGLVRSSSVTDVMPLMRAEEAAAAALVRTASLPPVTEEEWRKRKELQSLRRMEAKRKRSDKKRYTSDSAVPGSGGPGLERLWPIELDDRSKNRKIDNLNLNPGQPGKSNSGSRYPKQQNQGSGESHGGSKSSSNASESQRNTIQAEVSSKKKARGAENVIGNMPCVFTIGDGPRGRRVEGILYRYKKGEEVRIMCVCHGSFFTPAEFVNHAGAHNVAHPLKRIVVNPNASPFS